MGEVNAMSQKKFARSPLIYIQQPSAEAPKAPMQHNYVTPKKVKQSKKTESEPIKKVRSRALSRRHVNNTNEQEHDVNEDEQEKINVKKTKKFIDMNIHERIDYFLSRSSQLPELKCEIKTEERSYRGVITDFKADEVMIRVGRRKSSSPVPLHDIIDIRLLGF